jgi:hypothetical protein
MSQLKISKESFFFDVSDYFFLGCLEYIFLRWVSFLANGPWLTDGRNLTTFIAKRDLCPLGDLQKLHLILDPRSFIAPLSHSLSFSTRYETNSPFEILSYVCKKNSFKKWLMSFSFLFNQSFKTFVMPLRIPTKANY